MQRGRLLLIVAIVLIILSIGGIFLVLRFTQGGGGDANTPAATEQTVAVTATPAEMVQIIRAVQPIDRGAPIPTEAIGLVQWPAQYADPKLVITNPADVVSRTARFALQPGQPIFNTMIVESLEQSPPFGSDSAARIPPGFTAISIPYDKRYGVALAVRDGDHVNVIVSWALVDLDLEFQSVLPNLTGAVAPANSAFSIDQGATNITGMLTGVVVGSGPKRNAVGRATTDPVLNVPLYLIPQEPQRARLVTQSIIQNATVLHVGEFGAEKSPVLFPTAAPAPADANATATAPPPPTPTPKPPDIITLVVAPQDALVLDYVNRLMERYPNAVKLTYTLRSARDNNPVETQSVTLQYMFEHYNISLPAKLPYGLDSSGVAPAATPAP